mgnify:FL=1
MSYSSDIDLSSLHKANNIDAEVPYELSWHFNNKMHLHSHKHKKSEHISRNSSTKTDNDHIKSQTKHDVNNNFHAKAFKIKDDNFYSMHRGKSGTWPWVNLN